jgi:tRNA pseudouridine38-40 synthase
MVKGDSLLQNYMLVLAYDGTCYHGFQFQKNALTVQEVLENKLRKIYKRKIRVEVAGRTDAGVHARGQVVNLLAPPLLTPLQLLRALNRILPADIAVLKAKTVPQGFHVRRDAQAKIYTYTIDNGRIADVFQRYYAWYIHAPLNTEAMQKGARFLVGKHDFKAFQSANSMVKTTVRTLFSLQVKQENNLFIVYFKGDGFLYKMVRSITGTLVDVGRLKIEPREVLEILKSGERRRAGRTAPAKGLCLEKVLYQGPLYTGGT